jgi:hypothetical protein
MFNYMIVVCVFTNLSAVVALFGAFCFETLRDI